MTTGGASLHAGRAPDGWPRLAAEAMHGLAGGFVRMVGPHSESDHAALLFQFLAAFGNCIGRNAYFVAEADRHYTNAYCLIVGATAKGRKGTSYGHVKGIFTACDEDWVQARQQHGLSSGEGLIWAVRDPIEKEEAVRENRRAADRQVADEGVTDKRLLVVESEFAQCLRVIGREGNTLSVVVRNAWDTGELGTLVKNAPARATGAHISIIGHITKDEALRYLDRTEAANGFGNRFLWVCARRSKILPEGGHVPEQAIQAFTPRLRRAIEFGRQARELKRDDAARKLWIEIYPELSEGRPGLVGALTSRAEAQTMRLAQQYALLDESPVIRREHLLAGLALWAYADDSASFVFGATLGDPVADQILRELRARPEGLTRTQIRDILHGNRAKEETDRALELLLAHRSAWVERKAATGPGRPPETWFATTLGTPGGTNRSFRSFLSYPTDLLADYAGGADGASSATTETTKYCEVEGLGASGKGDAEPGATTETTETTEPGCSAAGIPGTTETPLPVDLAADVQAGEEWGADFECDAGPSGEQAEFHSGLFPELTAVRDPEASGSVGGA